MGNSAEHVLRWPAQPGVPTRYGLVPGHYLLSVGNQSPNKNISALIAAHTAAGSKGAPLAIVGGSVPGVAQAAVEQGRAIHLLGRVPDADLRGLYEGASGFVFPSLFEGFGIPPLEAMQLGVPVLCARAGAMPAVLGEAPLWFDPRDVSDMTRVLSDFAAMPDAQRKARGKTGLTIATQYRWADSAQRIIEIVSEVGARHQ